MVTLLPVTTNGKEAAVLCAPHGPAQGRATSTAGVEWARGLERGGSGPGNHAHSPGGGRQDTARTAGAAATPRGRRPLR